MEPKTHDYTRTGWGHGYSIGRVLDGGQKLSAIGVGRGISQGDYILMADGDGGTTRYQFESVTYSNDPKDLWRATLKFAPRQNALPEK